MRTETWTAETDLRHLVLIQEFLTRLHRNRTGQVYRVLMKFHLGSSWIQTLVRERILP